MKINEIMLEIITQLDIYKDVNNSLPKSLLIFKDHYKVIQEELSFYKADIPIKKYIFGMEIITTDQNLLQVF